MPERYRLSNLTSIPLCCVLVGLAVAAVGVAQESTISVLRHGVTTPLVLPEYTSQGVKYASMRDIATQLGAAVDVSDARALFQLDGKEAEAGLNDTQVRADAAQFALSFPILAYEGDALIAMDDVTIFLRKAFEFGTPDAPPERSALAMPAEVETPAIETEVPAIDAEMEGAMESVPLAPVVKPLAEDALPGLEGIEINPGLPENASAEGAPLSAFGDGDSVMVAIDPGHGGDDSGVVGAGGLVEKDLCLLVASNVRRLLKEQYGIATVMTREDDTSLAPAARLAQATAGKATLLISIHGGASSAPIAGGYRIFAHRGKRTLSTDPKPALGAAKTVAQTLDEATGQASRPVREIPLLIMRQGSLPCILVELGNLSNPEDEAKLTTESYQGTLAEAIARGIDAVVGGRTAARTAL